MWHGSKQARVLPRKKLKEKKRKRLKNTSRDALWVKEEARYADVGIAGGKGYGLLFRKGKIVGKVKEKDLIKALLNEVKALLKM